ncbi:MAG: hypothetical protein EBS19_01975 [Spirochaetia bacterium]|nr:hypothetical protein [Spirochaetia bacterium]
MIYFKIKKRFFLILLTIYLVNCTSYQIIKEEDWEKNKRSVTTKIGNLIVRSFEVEQSKGAVLLFDPIFVKKENLHPSLNLPMVPSDKTYLSNYTIYEEINYPDKCRGVLIPYLNKRGYSVYLVSPENLDNFSLKKIGQEGLKDVIAEIKDENIILGGVSLGGQAIAYYLASANISPKIQKAFFMGTGLDYKYSGSLINQIEKVSKKEENIKCKISEKDNLCNRLVNSLAIEKAHPRRAITYPNMIPVLEKDPSLFSGITNQNLEVLVIYGKLDSVSPEESILGLFFNGWGKGFVLNYLEASTSSNFGHDYDHFDLFYHKSAESEIYSVIGNWIGKKK